MGKSNKEWLKELEELLGTKDKEIATLESVIESRDKTISMKDEIIQAREMELTSLKETLESKEQTIERIRNIQGGKSKGIVQDLIEQPIEISYNYREGEQVEIEVIDTPSSGDGITTLDGPEVPTTYN